MLSLKSGDRQFILAGLPRSIGTGQRGRPMLASGEIAERVIGRAAELSKMYGVTVRNENGTGVVALG